MQITRYTNLNEQQFLGCVSAFADALAGELNSAAMYLRKLQARGKGSAFAYEMALDRHRYGALTILDRWSTFLAAFGPFLADNRSDGIVSEGAARVRAAEEILEKGNQVLDAAGDYAPEVAQVCMLAFQSANGVFAEERAMAERMANLGPLLSEDFKQARGIFLGDLAAR